MKEYFKKLIRLIKFNTVYRKSHLFKIQDCVNMLYAIYDYKNSKKYNKNQRDILNLRIAEIKLELINHLNYITC